MAFRIGYKKATTKIIIFCLSGTCEECDLDEVLTEAKKYNDIIMFDFLDTNYNLTTKTLVSLAWAYKHVQAEYYLKVDDDMFVSLNNIMTLIEKSNYGNRTIIGLCHFNSSPFRDKRSKYYMSFDMYSRAHYPPFCLGTGYLMTRAAVKAVLAHGATTPLTRLEDTSVGILAEKAAKVKFVNVPRWRSERFTNSCPRHYTQHSLTAKQFQQAWSMCVNVK